GHARCKLQSRSPDRPPAHPPLEVSVTRLHARLTTGDTVISAAGIPRTAGSASHSAPMRAVGYRDFASGPANQEAHLPQTRAGFRTPLGTDWVGSTGEGQSAQVPARSDRGDTSGHR